MTDNHEKRNKINFKKMPNEELYLKCIKGDLDAWRYVYNYVFKIVRNSGWHFKDGREDMTQEIVIHLVDKAIFKVKEPKKFKSFIAKVAKNKMMDETRTYSNDPIVLKNPRFDDEGNELDEENPSPDPSPYSEALREEAFEIIERNLMQLDKECQAILRAYFKYVLGYYESYKELNEVLKRPIGTISTRVTRCMRALRKKTEIRELFEED